MNKLYGLTIFNNLDFERTYSVYFRIKSNNNLIKYYLFSRTQLTLVADAYVGIQEVDIPVDTTLSSLHVKIDAPMRSATLETPNGG